MPFYKKYVRDVPANAPYHAQGVEVPGTKRPGQTGHYINGIYGFFDPNDPAHFNVLTTAFETGLEVAPNSPCLGHRPKVSKSPLKFADTYVWETYKEVDVRRKAVGSALDKLFRDGTLDVGTGDLQCVGVWAPNSPEWQITDFACNAYNKVTVSLYDTLGDDSVEYIINHAHLPIVFCTLEHVPSLLKLKATTSIPLKYIVCIGEIPAQVDTVLDSWSKSVGIQLASYKQFEELGQQNPREPIPAHRDQVLTICYTSGTTGNPKGVVITHLMMSMAVQANLCGLNFEEGDATLLSYLPLAHIYERLCSAGMFAVAGRIGYFTGDHLRLLEDAQALKPNFFPSVPRVLNRVYQAGIVAANAPGLKGLLFRKAMAAKIANLEAGAGNTHAFWDRLVFRKLRAVLGGQVEMLASGSAPISREVMNFLKVAFSCAVVEGEYGMTENCATCNRTFPADPTSGGTVGPPQASVEIKLIDVPSMSYLAEDKPNPRGEICVRGPASFLTYYKDEANTKKTVDADGWARTGDVGEIDSCGRLIIIDRVKNIMKLAQGEYVALEKIENVYSRHPVIQQLYVHGDGLQSYLVAVVIPDPVQLAAGVYAVTKKHVKEDLEALKPFLQDPAVAAWVHRQLNTHAVKAGLKGFETVKRIHLSDELFSVDNGTMTPTFKIKRKEAHQKYKPQIDGLYSLGEPTSSTATKL